MMEGSPSLQEGEEEEDPVCRICHAGEKPFIDSMDLLNTLETFVTHNLLESSAAEQILDQKQLHSSNSSDDLIAPCKCKGTIKYVHRKCLNDWRYSRNSYNLGNNITAAIVAGVGANTPNPNQNIAPATTLNNNHRSIRNRAFYQCERCGFEYRLRHSFLSKTLGDARFQRLLYTSLFFISWILCIIFFEMVSSPTVLDDKTRFQLAFDGIYSYNSMEYLGNPYPLHSICSKVFETPKEDYYKQARTERSIFKTSKRHRKPAVKEGYATPNNENNDKDSNPYNRRTISSSVQRFVNMVVSSSLDYFDFLRSNSRFFCPFLRSWPPFVFFQLDRVLENRLLNDIFLFLHANWESLIYGTILESIIFFIFVTPTPHMIVNILFMAYRAQHYNYAVDMICLILFLILGLSNTYLQLVGLVSNMCENFVRSKLYYVEDCFGNRSDRRQD